MYIIYDGLTPHFGPVASRNSKVNFCLSVLSISEDLRSFLTLVDPCKISVVSIHRCYVTGLSAVTFMADVRRRNRGGQSGHGPTNKTIFIGHDISWLALLVFSTNKFRSVHFGLFT